MKNRVVKKGLYTNGAVIAGRYQVVQVLGVGSLGTVLHVIDFDLDYQSLALKILHPHLVQDSDAFQRFRNEVLLTRQLTHPNIIRIYDVGTTEHNAHFLTMEYVEGCNLRELASSYPRSRMPVEDLSYLLYGIAKGLAFAHNKKIIHRDLKPDNILVSADGAVKISDFGFAKSFEVEQGMTRTGETVGSPCYMAPEQFLDEQEVDNRSDIYSLGILSFEMLSGCLPFLDESYFVLAEKHRTQPLPLDLLEEIDIPAPLMDWITVATEKKKELRGAGAEELRALFERGAASFNIETPAELVETVKRIGARKQSKQWLRHCWTITQIVALAVVVFAFYVTVNQGRPQEAMIAKVLQAEHYLSADLGLVKRYFKILDIQLDEPKKIFTAPISEGVKFAVSYVLAFGDQSVRSESGDSLFHLAAKEGNPNGLMLIFLMEPGLINARNKSGQTPLMVALENESLGLIEFLQEKGANPNIPDNKMMYPVHRAVMQRSKNAVLLLQKSFRLALSVKTREGLTPLHLAVKIRSREMLELLLQHAADVNVRDSKGRTALMLELSSAYGEANEEMVDLLLRYWTDLKAKDNSGQDIFDHAVVGGSMQLLQKAGIVVSTELIEPD